MNRKGAVSSPSGVTDLAERRTPPRGIRAVTVQGARLGNPTTEQGHLEVGANTPFHALAMLGRITT
jgi:hypothetical protein